MSYTTLILVAGTWVDGAARIHAVRAGIAASYAAGVAAHGAARIRVGLQAANP
jgi:hypothetical protein